MVRFKNRWLLVEFLYPSSQPVPSTSSLPSIPPPSPRPSKKPRRSKRSSSSDEECSEHSSDEEVENDVFPNLGALPLLLPPPPTGKKRTLDEKSIFLAMKSSVLQVFGDDGWGRVAGGTAVKYYSPHTNLCIIRCARDHYRTVWASLSLLGPVNGERVIARVIRCSGTIKKIQKATVTYNRLLVSSVLAATAPSAGPESKANGTLEDSTVVLPPPPGEKGWKGWEEREQVVLEDLID